MELADWKRSLEEERKLRDESLAVDPKSPIPAEERKTFKGLDYYPPNLDYRFEVELHEHEEKQTVRMNTASGQELELIRWGEFRFEFEGKRLTLQVYRRSPEDRWLFIPFRDRTNGKETYGAGRFLYFHLKEPNAGTGRLVLDFNRAYNPFCAYSPGHGCPLVPPENWLDVPIYAGEKVYAKRK